ncbi:MAG: methyltransferase domain-containing protein [Myxococcota bacterium]
MRRVLVGFALASFAAGLAASAFWLRYGDTSGFAATPLWVAGVSLATLCALSAVSLAVRWLRWHFLLRRTIATLPTQTSVKLYFATLPAFATPLYLGELIRTALAARRVPHARVGVFAIWAVERLADAATLGAFLLAAQGRWGPLALLAAAGFGAVAAVRSSVQNPTLRALSSPQVLTALGLSSATCWAMPILGLWIAAGQLGEPITPTAATQVFSLATLLGGISMLPLGAGVTGTSLIVHLSALGVSPDASLVLAALLRAGTTWFAFGLGILALIRWRGDLMAIARQTPAREHFETLAPDYGDEIPKAVRDRVVGRKVGAMESALRAAGVPAGARGLDVGCGQGWYAVAMAKRGYEISACDRSRAQVGQALRFVRDSGVSARIAVADSRALPYADGSFDFAYGVNVFHHISGAAQRERALAEIARVLKPGASFFLQEINTENPLFAFYMSYLFPLLRNIDVGTEEYLKPSALPAVEGARWADDKVYLTFLPDFTPAPLLELFAGVERALERSRLRTWSAHYMAQLVVAGAPQAALGAEESEGQSPRASQTPS